MEVNECLLQQVQIIHKKFCRTIEFLTDCVRGKSHSLRDSFSFYEIKHRGIYSLCKVDTVSGSKIQSQKGK